VAKNPKKAGDRVKTDRRDAMQLARLMRSGGLTPYGQNIQTHCFTTGYASTMIHAST